MVERQFDGLLRATPDLELCKTKIKLKTLKKDLPVVGECDVTFENEIRATDANIIIVQGKMDSLPLLGRQTLEELGMVKFDASGSLKQPNRETTKNVRKLESRKPEMMKLYEKYTMYAPNMAATIFNSAILTIFLALSSAILSGKHWFDLSRDLIASRRKLYRLPAPTRPICVWQKHGDICLFLPFSHQDITIAMDIKIQPGPYSLIPNSIGSRSLQQSQPIHAISGSIVNSNFPAKNIVYSYSRHQLLELRSRAPVSTNLFLSLKDLGILRTRRVRAGKKAKQRSCAIPVILGRRNERSTQVYFSDLKLQYYQDVNKPSKLRLTANNLINSSAHDHAQNHKNLIVVTSREQNNSKDLIALQNWQSNSQCLSFNAATINCESANNKTLDLTDYISEQDIDVCCLTETWMTENDPVTAGELCPPGYKLKSIPRKDRRGGGVAIILKQQLH